MAGVQNVCWYPFAFAVSLGVAVDTEPYVPICFSSRNPKKAIELTEEPQPVHSGTSTCPQKVKYEIKYQHLFTFYAHYM